MNNLFKDLKKYLWVIIIVCLIGLNSYSINQNAYYINDNTGACFTLAQRTSILADSFKMFIQNYRQNKKQDPVLLRQIIIETESRILFNKIERLNNQFNPIIKKPSFQYLKSVTVFVRGEETQRKLSIIDKIFGLKKPDKWSGTGVVVKIDSEYTYVLTNKHVAESEHSYNLYIGKNKKTRKKVALIKLHKWQDLALLKIKGSLKTKQAIKGLVFPQITENVYTCGHPIGRTFMYGEGVYSGTNTHYDIYQLPSVNGQSGSGIFNKTGQLIGLIRGGYGVQKEKYISWDYTRSCAVKAIYIKEFLEELL